MPRPFFLALLAWCVHTGVFTAEIAPSPAVGTIAPVAATASGAQACSPQMVIDGSGLSEDPVHAGVFVHSANRWADGGSMWTSGGETVDDSGACWLRVDLGRSATVTGLHLWNYNEGGGWSGRSIKQLRVLISNDDQAWTPIGDFTLRQAAGDDHDAGEALTLKTPVQARYLKLVPTATYGRDNLVGLSELRVRVSDPQPSDRVLAPRATFVPRYARTTYAPRALAQPFAGSENIAWPADAGVIDITQPPYNARGDGINDDTAAINRALAEQNDRGAIIFLPNGIYRISDTIRWGAAEKFTTLMGQSQAGAVLRLDDHAAGFTDARVPKAVLWTGGDPAQRFGNEVAHLTIDTGAENPGCSGVAFVANNQGVMQYVTIVSGDGQGIQGLNLGAAGENGPLLVRALTVIGFDVGVAASSSINGQVIEGLTLRDQNRCGVRTFGQHLTIRHLTSTNAVPACERKGGVTVLLDSTLTGSGAATSLPALCGSGTLYARHVAASGYACALEGVAGGTLDEYVSTTPATLFAGKNQTKHALNLPIKELPSVQWEPVATWVSPLGFGGKPDDDQDDAPALQHAIDSGATTVYLPRGKWRLGSTVILRGTLKRLVGCRAFLDTVDGKPRSKPLLRVADGDGAVSIERLFGPWHNTRVLKSATQRTVIVRQCANVSASFVGGGDVFLDDVVNNPGANFTFTGVSVWARQFNAEAQGVHVRNDHAQVWILGMKTESDGTLIETVNGGATELLGGLSYTSGGSGGVPMFTVSDSRFSATLGEVCWDDRFYRVIVRETRAGVTREFLHDDPRWGRALGLFTTEAKK